MAWNNNKNGAILGNPELGMDVMDFLTRGTVAVRDGKEIRVQDVAAEVYDASRNANIFMKVATASMAVIALGSLIFFISKSGKRK